MSYWISLFVALTIGGTAMAQVQPIQEVFSPNPKSYPSDQYGKVAVVAWVSPQPTPLTTDPSVAENFKAQNRETLANYIREAASNGAKLIVTPEFGVVGYPDIPDLPPEEDNFQSPEQIAPYAERVPGRSTDFFGRLAKQLKVYIQFGMAEEESPGHYHNTAVVVGPNGKVVAKYRKVHLYEIETHFLEPGNQPVTYNSPFGKVGIIICSDVYSPLPMDNYRNQHVDVLTLSTSWAQWNTGWETFTQGAQEDHAYLLAANQTYFPDSGVIAPDGGAQSHIRQSSGIAYGYLPYKNAALASAINSNVTTAKTASAKTCAKKLTPRKK